MSIRIRKILLPTDFSDYSATATNYACQLAEKFEAELHLLHILEIQVDPTPSFAMGLDLVSYVTESKTAAEAKIADLLDPQWSAGRKVIRSVVEGSPRLEIIQYARQEEIDLVVMTTHGRTGLAHVIMGSVAESVVRTAPCPVLTVRPEGHQFVMP